MRLLGRAVHLAGAAALLGTGLVGAALVGMALVGVALVGAGLAGCGAGRPGAGGPAGGPAGRPAAQVAASSRQVSFTVAGTVTYGTLDVPAHRPGQRLAAALLLAGSGPTDRNGNDLAAGLAPDTLRLIAGVLARMGIMSLRFDKYFSGRTGGGTFGADPGAISLADYIRQADAAYGFLRAQPAADPRRMLVAGHSEGGMYALLVAGSVTPRPAGLALIEPQDERLLSLVELQAGEQLDAQVRQGMLTAAAAGQDAAWVRRAVSEFRAGRPVDAADLPPGVTGLIASELLTPANARYVRSDDAVYPPAAAARLARGTRVLVTEGTADTNVPVATIGPLAGALAAAGTTGPGLRVLAGVNHLLHLPGVAASTQALAPAAVAALQDWARPFAAP